MRVIRTVLVLGDVVEVTHDIDLRPYATVRRGERGCVVWVDEATGNTDIQLEEQHNGLREWDNCMSVIPAGETDDILNSLTKEVPCKTASPLERSAAPLPLSGTASLSSVQSLT